RIKEIPLSLLVRAKKAAAHRTTLETTQFLAAENASSDRTHGQSVRVRSAGEKHSAADKTAHRAPRRCAWVLLHRPHRKRRASPARGIHYIEELATSHAPSVHRTQSRRPPPCIYPLWRRSR